MKQTKRIILTMSTGRCGTQLLAHIMALLPGVCSGHETDRLGDRRPHFTPEVMEDYVCNHMLPRIEQTKLPIYFESSHLICKDLLPTLLAAGVKFDLVFLFRPIQQIALSLYHLNDIPGRTKTGLKYYLDPADPDNIFPIDPDEYSNLQLCIWYCIEMHRRMQEVRQAWGALGWGHCTINMQDLLQWHLVDQMFVKLGLSTLDSHTQQMFKNVVSVKHNDKIPRKWHLARHGIVERLGPGIDFAREIKYMQEVVEGAGVNVERLRFYTNLNKLYKEKEYV